MPYNQPGCLDCGGKEENPNPLDCGKGFMSCQNPCAAGPGNTPACESLPSQIENFTLQFFGEVFKTEVNGEVTWSLPCGLDVGLPANPRGVNEGLACYFLRLFQDGIGGLQGPQGDQGNPGTDGNNAYSVTTQAFTVPPAAAVAQFVIIPNPSIQVGMFVFMSGAGWFQVTDVEANGVIFASIVQGLVGTGTTIPAGALVTPTGPPGPAGQKGNVGNTGAQGLPGQDYTVTHGTYAANPAGTYPVGSTNFPVPANGVWGVVDYVSSAPQVFVPSTGQFLVTVSIPVQAIPGVSPTDEVNIRLIDVTSGVPILQSVQNVNDIDSGQIVNLLVQTITGLTAGHVLGVQVTTTSASSYFRMLYIGTTITWVRLS